MPESLAGLEAIVITVSDSVSRGTSQDASGPEVRSILEHAGAEVLELQIVPDDREQIEKHLISACERAALVITTGGTGVAPRDVTPDATLAVSERVVPGIGESMRRVSLEKTPHAILSRAGGAILGRSLILNLPGSPGGVRDCLNAVLDVIPHAVKLVGEEPTPHLQT